MVPPAVPPQPPQPPASAAGEKDYLDKEDAFATYRRDPKPDRDPVGSEVLSEVRDFVIIIVNS